MTATCELDYEWLKDRVNMKDYCEAKHYKLLKPVCIKHAV